MANARLDTCLDENITLADDLCDSFMSACEQAEKPNDALLEAVEFAKNSSIKNGIKSS